MQIGTRLHFASDIPCGTKLPPNPQRYNAVKFLQEFAFSHVCVSPKGTPFPEGEPLVMAQEGQSVTFTCTETTSLPPANTTWKKGQQQEDVPVGPKYSLSGNGPVFNLTIRNVSKDDEGVYFCRSENPLAVRELEVYLTVRGECEKPSRSEERGTVTTTRIRTVSRE